jgi:adenine phosphoribosyltransferase
MDISTKLKKAIRDVPDFPKEGIIFKDITPVFSDLQLCKEIVDEFSIRLKDKKFNAIACLDARGFWFGFSLSQKLGIPFVPIRKRGKLPFKTISYSYDLEYGSATVEMHIDAIEKGWNILIHDDLLATGGTAAAAAELVEKMGGKVGAFAFIVELGFLNGNEKLQKYGGDIISLLKY